MRVIYLSLLLLFISPISACSVMEGDSETSVFYAPHADDEVLSLGPSILRQLDKGNTVAVVLLSHGEASQSLEGINKMLIENKETPITVEEFGDSRVMEFRRSAKELEIEVENVFVYDLPDGEIKKEDVTTIMLEMDNRYPSASHHTLSYEDPHRDHAAAGLALKELVEKGTIESALYYLPIQEFENLEYDEAYTVPKNRTDEYNNSLNAYRVWMPDKGFYSIGYHSVRSYFKKAETYKESRWHK
ncbi:PIG-L family deacetylase [Anaerobacillus sp. 1_MG-2023]|uniref:PIG-L family deacetylase n=1 Tax=Anaerobacillus sp. 1_MG-2023 TaxID=3062655 RepID=UPI0026E2E1A3|nr:PIG-L family deacetylase [Anaerobacillus sp. 1_MG-2023]MDO6657782.1 PIG-L family deacetylase [Anaerobacillus sp. 1_MG-2023]